MVPALRFDFFNEIHQFPTFPPFRELDVRTRPLQGSTPDQIPGATLAIVAC